MKISAILPTRGRSDYASQALRSFLAQTYANRELIILDDSDDPSFPKWRPVNGVHYLRADERLSIPAKRNKCCEMASGEVICHWDSDDWSDPRRIQHQAELMQKTGMAVVGYHSMLFYSTTPPAAYLYLGYPRTPIGTSLMYTREWWSKHRFRTKPENFNVGEDTCFGEEARDENQIMTWEAGSLMVARIHPGNTSIKHLGPTQVEYRPVAMEHIPAGFFK